MADSTREADRHTNQKFMLTTIDNPFDPHTQYDSWVSYDEQLGYFTNALLARVLVTSESFTDDMQDDDIERAIDDIVAENPLGIYRKVALNG